MKFAYILSLIFAFTCTNQQFVSAEIVDEFMFKIDSQGASDIKVSSSIFPDETGEHDLSQWNHGIVISTGETIKYGFTDRVNGVDVSLTELIFIAVPEPNTTIMLGSCLLLLTGRRKRSP